MMATESTELDNENTPEDEWVPVGYEAGKDQ